MQSHIARQGQPQLSLSTARRPSDALTHLCTQGEPGIVYFRAMHKTGEQICASDSFRASWQKDEPDKDIIRVTCCQMQTRRRDPLVGRKRLYFKVASLQSVSIPKQAGFSRQLRQTVVCVRVRVCLCVCVH